MLLFIWLVIATTVVAACQDQTPPNCVVQMDNAQTFRYSLQAGDDVTQSEARVAAARAGDYTFIRIEDSDAFATVIDIRISKPLIAGDGFYYNSSGSYPPDYEFTIRVSGDAPSGEPAVYSGGFIVADVSESSFGGSFDFSPYHLVGTFNNIEFQSCVE
jgi:hypothetical protein